MIGLVIFNFCFLIYSAFQIKEFHNVIFGDNTVPQIPTGVIYGIADDSKDFQDHGDVFDDNSVLRKDMPGYEQARSDFWGHLLPFIVAVPAIIALAQVFYLLCAFKLYRVFGWDIYQKLGASTTVKNYFLSYQVFVVLLIYDWFFFGGFVVQMLILFVDSSDW